MTTTTVDTFPVPSTPSADPNKAARRRRRRQLTDRVVISLLVLAAAVFQLWPVAGTYWNNWKAWEFAQTANHRISSLPTNVTSTALADARAYNDALPPSLLSDPWTTTTGTSPEYRAYLDELAEGATMGTLRAPTIGATLPILHGTSDAALAKGAGHVYGTHLPVGGLGTHSGLSAHTALPNMTAFDNLPDMKVGDQFFIDVYGETLAYQVTGTKIVLPNAMGELARVDGKDLVTLITCTPYAINSHRLLVTGERIPWSEVDKEAAAPAGFNWQVQDWMKPKLAIAAGALLLLVGCFTAWIVHDVRRSRARKDANTVLGIVTNDPPQPPTPQGMIGTP